MRESIEACDRMPATKEIVFDVVSQIDVLERWLPQHVAVRTPPARPDGEQARVGAASPDAIQEGTLRVDPERWRVEWSGGTGEDEFAGWIQVAEGSAGTSDVTIHVSGAGDSDEADLRESLRDLYLAVSKRVTSP